MGRPGVGRGVVTFPLVFFLVFFHVLLHSLFCVVVAEVLPVLTASEELVECRPGVGAVGAVAVVLASIVVGNGSDFGVFGLGVDCDVELPTGGVVFGGDEGLRGGPVVAAVGLAVVVFPVDGVEVDGCLLYTSPSPRD